MKGKPRPAQAKVSFDHQAGAWMVPMSDSLLDMLTGDWSAPVQLRALDDGTGYHIQVREADSSAQGLTAAHT